MAVWQFEFYVIPDGKRNIAQEDILSWKERNLKPFEVPFLEAKEGWTKKMILYGESDQTCIELWYKEDVVDEILCRLDLRTISEGELKQIVDLIKQVGGNIFYCNNIYAPSAENLLLLIKNSAAYRFCQNPRKYIKEKESLDE